MASMIRTKWPSSKIRDLCDVSRGSSPRPIADQRYFEGGDIPWIKIADATKSGKYLYETKEYVNKYGASFSKILPAGTIIVAASGTLGYTQILGVSGCAHDGWLILANLRNFDKDFAYYVLQQMQQHFYNSAYGAAIQNINTEILRETEIPYPPIVTQRKIASILSAYDDLIENNLRRIKILEEMAQNLYREWFVKFRFPGHEKIEFIDSPLGKIPEGWAVKCISDYGKVITGKTPSKAKPQYYGYDVPFVKTPDMRGSIFVLTTNDMLSKEGALSQAKKMIPSGSLCVSCIGTIGVVSITTQECQTNQQINTIVLENSEFTEFLFFRLKDAKNTLENLGSAGATMGNVNKGKFSALKIIAPPLHMISNYHDFTRPIFKQILVLYRRIRILRQTRDLLLPRLISGELDVSELDIDIPEDTA